jgi:hypothetical protein
MVEATLQLNVNPSFLHRSCWGLYYFEEVSELEDLIAP